MRIAMRIGTIALATVCLAGCKSDPSNTEYKAISRNLTPELRTVSQRPVDVDTAIQVTNNMNWRLMWEDMGRVFLTDQPSTLAPHPVTNTNGTN